MNEEKQIEEIVLTVKTSVVDNALILSEEDRIILDGNDLDHAAEQTAEVLTAKNYRKASEVAREVIGKLEQEIAKCFQKCFKWEGNTPERREMLNYNAHIKILFAELKKKNTERDSENGN